MVPEALRRLLMKSELTEVATGGVGAGVYVLLLLLENEYEGVDGGVYMLVEEEDLDNGRGDVEEGRVEIVWEDKRTAEEYD